jgi:hypothetical protein
MKLQIEIFFLFCLKIISDEQTPTEQIELIVETITQLWREHSFVVDLFINYDCSTVNDNLLEMLVEFFYEVSPFSGNFCALCASSFFFGIKY